MSTPDWFLVSRFLLLPAAVGHLALWVTVFNLLHATPIPCRTVDRLEKLILLATLGLPAWLLYDALAAGQLPWEGTTNGPGAQWLFAYACLCWLAAAVWSGEWLLRRMVGRVTSRLVSNDTRRIDVAAELGTRPLEGFTVRLLDRVPGNEILTLQIHQKVLAIPRLAPKLEGLRIVHISDLHFTGAIGRPYFEYVIDQANQWDAELVVVTGDIVDNTACQSWLPDTLGRLRAKEGKFFVLGNHDLRVDSVARLREEVEACGLEDLGGRCRCVSIRDTRILLAGNERPWFLPLPDVPPVENPRSDAEPLRILLSHTPDQIGWARRNQFDLMLAGHTHGGQIRLPVVGPVVAPSKYGVKFASGVFYREPTLMHVSRGVSGLQPIRWNCPPELALLQLTRHIEHPMSRRPAS